MLLPLEVVAEERAVAFEPILSSPLPDPYVYRDETDWYIFGTGMHFFQGRTLSRSGMRRNTIQIDFSRSGRRPRGIWGFVPYRHFDGSYHAYCTLDYGNFQTVVAHLLPASGECWASGHPIRNWKLDRVLVGDASLRQTTFYESKYVVDETGEQYLIYCAAPARHRNVHIMAQRMLGPGTVDASHTARPILSPGGYRSEDRNPGYIQLVEGPNIFRLGDKYAMLYSAGDFARNNYKLGVAWSDRLIPAAGETYRKVIVPDLKNIWRNADRREEVHYLLQSESRQWPNYCGDVVVGPGLGNVIKTGDGHHLVFHGYAPAERKRHPNRREVWMLPLEIRISDSTPVHEWLRPVLPGRDTPPIEPELLLSQN